MTAAIIALLSSDALATIILAIITAISNRKSRLKAVEKKLDDIEQNQKLAEKDTLRTQLIMMIADYPEEMSDILKLGEHYFKDLKGNWTATAIFNRWLEKYCDGIKPEWFQE